MGTLSKEEPHIPMRSPESFPFKKTSPMQRKHNNLFPSQGPFAKSLTVGAQLGVMASSGPFWLRWCVDAEVCPALLENSWHCWWSSCKRRTWGYITGRSFPARKRVYQHLASTSTRWRWETKRQEDHHTCATKRVWWCGLLFPMISWRRSCWGLIKFSC